MNYLKRRKEERKYPERYFDGAKSILCFGLYYFPGWASGSIKVSNYAWGTDYHDVLRSKLEDTVKDLKKLFGEFQYRLTVDTSPVLEKPLAVQAGLGWQGKNTLLLNSKFGSYLFLGEIISDLPLEAFQSRMRVNDHCGSCTRCIEACPTDALSPYDLDARKCISYWTLEHRGAFPPEVPRWKEWIAGCDICQEVCPWNQRLIPLKGVQEPAPLPLDKLREGRALSYVPLADLERNLTHVTEPGETPSPTKAPSSTLPA